MKLAKNILAGLLLLAITFGGGTYYGYQMPRSGVDPQDYIETVITPYEDGIASYIKFLDKAHKSVHIAAYSFTHDDITAKLIELKTTRNVLVRVLLDQSQSGGPDQKEQIEKLRVAGIEVVIGKSESYGQIMHHKYTVIDGLWTETGSWNYSNSATKQANYLDFIESESRAKRFQVNWERMYKFMKANEKPVSGKSRR
ncbi:MAG: phospholipase D-like domain-containing protein [Candidatus Melainabacteria bacterium]|nr:phospholipase D-like domain-containing protein [Candidatus Melainabacteria bacterium]